MKERRLAGVWIGLAVAAFIAGCSGENAASLQSSAKDLASRGDHNAAVVQFKAALQMDGASAELRYLLGKSLLELGEAPAAELELRKALTAGYSKDLVIPELARAMSMQQLNKPLIEEFGGTTISGAASAADLKATLAEAHLGLGNRNEAKEHVAEALRLSPTQPAAVIMSARLKLLDKDQDGALAQLQDLLTRNPKDIGALQLIGAIKRLGKGDLPGAIEAYKKVIEIRPKHLPAYANLFSIYLAQQRDLAAASELLVALKKVLSNHPQVQFFEAQMAYIQGDALKARELILGLLRLAPNEVRLLQFAGAVELKLNALVQAEAYLAKALSQNPDLPFARKLLATVYLNSGQANKALQTLRNAQDAASADAETLALAAEAHLQIGDMQSAEAEFLRAAQLAPDNVKLQTAVALTRLSRGQAGAAFSDLQAIAAKDSGQYADMALTSARLRRGEVDEALVAIEALARKDPKNATAQNWRGRVLALKGDLKGAQVSFDRALAINPSYFPAVSSLVGLDLIDGRPDDAMKRYESLLKLDPKHGGALLGIAELKTKTGAPMAEIRQTAEAAVQANSTDVGARLFLVNYLIAREPKAALSSAQAAVAAIPDNLALQDALGRAQAAAGEYNQALNTFSKLVPLAPKSADPYVRMSRVQALAGNLNQAASDLRRALDLSPGDTAIQRSLIGLAQQLKRPEVAVEAARAMQRQYPDQAAGFGFEGDIAAASKSWEPAIASYRKGLGKKSDGLVAERLHDALAASGRKDEAEKFAFAWAKDHPNDSAFFKHIGEHTVMSGNIAGGEVWFANALKASPNDTVAMNNMAWILVKLGKPGALDLVSKAANRDPNNAAVMDTLALAAAQAQDFPRAIKSARRALAISQGAPGYRMSLARLLIQSGDTTGARAELAQLATMGAKFEGQGEVTSLLNSLK